MQRGDRFGKNKIVKRKETRCSVHWLVQVLDRRDFEQHENEGKRGKR